MRTEKTAISNLSVGTWEKKKEVGEEGERTEERHTSEKPDQREKKLKIELRTKY